MPKTSDCTNIVAWFHKDFPDTVCGTTSPMPKEIAEETAKSQNEIFSQYLHTVEPYVPYETKRSFLKKFQ